MGELKHYGIKGQKWGIRRYQNSDGTLTSAGRLRYSKMNTRRYIKRTSSDVQSIIDSMSEHDRDLIGAPDVYIAEDEIEDVAKRFVKRVGSTPVAFLNIYYDGEKAGNVVIGTRSGEAYRGKGYATELVKRAQNWFESDYAKDVLQMNALHWYADKSNVPSLLIAKRYGFEERKDYTDSKQWSGSYKR